MKSMILPIACLTGLLAHQSAAADSGLPDGLGDAVWGMTVSDLESRMELTRADRGDGFGYAEHLEEEPEVYIRQNAQHERVEYYFSEGRLYKIFIVYDRVLFHTPFYKDIVERTTVEFGPPGRIFQEDFFGLSIQHTQWEDAASILDLRKGAGFIYQVRIHKQGAEEKARRLLRKKSI